MTDTTGSPNHILDFVIPRGDTGPAGGGGLIAYGGLYNDGTQTLQLSAGVDTIVGMSTSMPLLDVTNTPANSLTVTLAGVYEIHFSLNATLSVAAALSASVHENGAAVPGSLVIRQLAVATGTIYSGTVIAQLQAGSVLQLIVSSSVDATLTLSGGDSASLTVKRLDA